MVHHSEYDLVALGIGLLEHEDPEHGDGPVDGVGLLELRDLDLVLQAGEDETLLGRVLLTECAHLLAQGEVAVGAHVGAVHLKKEERNVIGQNFNSIGQPNGRMSRF